MDVIDRLGDYFSEQVLGEKFRPEPVLSFILNDGIPAEIKSAIGRGVNQGAFIVVPDRDRPLEAGAIDGRRIRLTHLLAPLYRLPLVLGRAVDLSSILSDQSEPEKASTLLLDLFSAGDHD